MKNRMKLNERDADGSEDWRAIAIFEDGSGEAGRYYDAAMEAMRERVDVINLKRLFIESHKYTLAGLSWSVGYLDPEIEVQHGRYRGKKAGPKDIAALWPNAEWCRKRCKYSDGLTYDWCAMVDGVTIRIARAEREKPQPKLSEGRILLSRERKMSKREEEQI